MVEGVERGTCGTCHWREGKDYCSFGAIGTDGWAPSWLSRTMAGPHKDDKRRGTLRVSFTKTSCDWWEAPRLHTILTGGV